MNNKILNTKNILAAAVLAATAVTSVNVMAEESKNVAVSVEVSNAFTLTKGADLSLGKIRVTGDGIETATYTISADPAATVGTATSTDSTKAVIQELTYGSPATFTIEGVANYAPLTLSVPNVGATAIDLVHSDPTSNKLQIIDILAYSTTDNAPVTMTAGVGTITADGEGKFAFNVGAKISTVAAAAAYTDGNYVANFDVKVKY